MPDPSQQASGITVGAETHSYEEWVEIVQGILFDQPDPSGNDGNARGLLSGKWEIGDLALALAPIGKTHARSGALAILAKFAEDVGVVRNKQWYSWNREMRLSLSSLREFRRVAAAWPADTDDRRQSYGVYATLAAHPRRREILAELTRGGNYYTTVAAARQALRDEAARRPGGR
jgi:hypothetical protein